MSTAWAVLQAKLTKWIELVLGHTKYADATKFYSFLADPKLWVELLAALDPSFKVTGKTNEEQFASILTCVPQQIPISGLKDGKQDALLELLLRIVWKYTITNKSAPVGAMLAWMMEFVFAFPCVNVANWPASVRLDDHIGPLRPNNANKPSAKPSNPVFDAILSDAKRTLKGLSKVFDKDLAKRILCGSVTTGDVDAIIKICLRKLVRLFTSSTFTDTELERNILMSDVYPFLRLLCQMFGYLYEVVDMRWGVREVMTLTHGTGELCITELHKCLQRSVGPAFITFLGDKYGYRPIPTYVEHRILAQIWENMKTAQIDQARTQLQGNTAITTVWFDHLKTLPLESVWSEVEKANAAKLFVEKDLLLIPMWYRVDSNRVPPVYTLQNISTVLPEYSSPDSTLQRAADNKWWNMMGAMQQLFRGNLAGLSKEEQTPFVISITETEVRNGILENPNFKDQSFCVLRKIGDLATFTDPRLLGRFIDLTPEKKIDDAAVKLLQALKKETGSAVDAKRSATYDVEGKEVGLVPDAVGKSPSVE